MRDYRHYYTRGERFVKGHFSRSRMEGLLRGRLYRSRNGLILGVCRGLADYFNLSVKWVRIIAIVLFIFTGFWPTGVIYLLAAFVMKPEPIIYSGRWREGISR